MICGVPHLVVERLIVVAVDALERLVAAVDENSFDGLSARIITNILLLDLAVETQ